MKSILLVLILLSGLSCSGKTNYYVSNSGSDQGPGSLTKPFKSLQKAVDVASAGDTIFLWEGSFHESVKISGLKGSGEDPVVIMPYNGAEVWLDGSIPITGDWVKQEENIYALKISEPVWQLFVDGKSTSSARWPNGNWNDGSIWNKTSSMAWPEKGKGGLGEHFNAELEALDFSLEKGGIIIVNSGSFKTYKSFIKNHNPGSDHFRYDTEGVRVHFGYEGRVEKFGYFLEGKKELIDVENEWFFEPKDSMLYVYFEKGTSPSDHKVRGKNLSYALDVEGSSFLVVRGINFFASTVSFINSSHITLEDCHFKFPSYSKRMLRDLGETEVTRFLVNGEFTPACDTIRNCVFEYMDGSVLDMNGAGNVVENCYMHHIDYSCTFKGGWTLNMIDAPELIFRRNTIHTTGASECLKVGRRNLVELNDISQTGFLQNDGALVQVSVKQQDQSITRKNWVHHSVKQGLRFDNSNKPNSPWGENGSMHHNVAWKTDRVFFKGENHFIYNNLVFDSHLNDLIISSDTLIQGWNYNTITRNNISNKFSGSRTKPGSDYPVPGIVDHNWDGVTIGADVRSQLRDPDNLDFRPRAGSVLVDGGAPIKGKVLPVVGEGPDIGPYEFGDDHYWIPGFQGNTARTPVPPDGATKVKTDADLMFLEAYNAAGHNLFMGSDSLQVAEAGTSSPEYMGTVEKNIFMPGGLTTGKTYYWRVDALSSNGVRTGETWSFTVE